MLAVGRVASMLVNIYYHLFVKIAATMGSDGPRARSARRFGLRAGAASLSCDADDFDRA